KRGDPPNPRDDVYSLGVIWYQLLTGDLSTGIEAHYAEDLQDRQVPAEVIELLGKCVQKPERRLASAAELVEQLGRLLRVATLVSSQNPAVYGEPLTFTATVKAILPQTGTPSGTVNFMDGTTTLQSVPLNGGTATLLMSALSAGSHLI